MLFRSNMNFGLDIGLNFSDTGTGSTCPINNNILLFHFFQSISLYIAVIFETVCQFSNLYFYSPLLIGTLMFPIFEEVIRTRC